METFPPLLISLFQKTERTLFEWNDRRECNEYCSYMTVDCVDNGENNGKHPKKTRAYRWGVFIHDFHDFVDNGYNSDFTRV